MCWGKIQCRQVYVSKGSRVQNGGKSEIRNTTGDKTQVKVIPSLKTLVREECYFRPVAIPKGKGNFYAMPSTTMAGGDRCCREKDVVETRVQVEL